MKKIFKAVVGGGGGGGPSKEEAAAAERAAAEANRKAQEAAQALQQNIQADLSTDNIALIGPHWLKPPQLTQRKTKLRHLGLISSLPLGKAYLLQQWEITWG